MPKRETTPSTYRLSEHARHVVAPKGITRSEWADVEPKCRELGIKFRPWQVPVGQLILAKRPDGKYAATVGGTGLSIPRQVGKTFLVGAIVFALCMLKPNLTVIWTAHRVRTAEETFGKMQAFAKRKRVAAYVAKIVLGSGEEAILFRNGSRILFGARDGGFGLGFDEVDVLIFDEAQRLKDSTLDDMIPATNQSRQASSALVLFMGTPPRPTDAGEVFTRMRQEALTGEDDDTGWIEFGADPDFEPTLAPAPLVAADWAQVVKANPSYPEDTPREAILRMRKKLGPHSFRREGLGIWDKVKRVESVIPLDRWETLSVETPPAETVPPDALGLDRWYDGATAVAACWRAGDWAHVEVLEADVVEDTRAVVEWLVVNAGRVIPVLIASDSPAAALEPLLSARGVDVRLVARPDYARACGGFYDDAMEGHLTHADQEHLTDALRGAQKKDIGQGGAWGWDRKDPDNDISPLVAATLARHGAVDGQAKKPSAAFAF